jgi:hypothetical protein
MQPPAPRLRPHSSEEPEALHLLRTAISGGDWELARSAVELVAGCAAPTSLEETRDRLDALTTVLNAARAGRAHLVDSAVRVTAAKRFQDGGR